MLGVGIVGPGWAAGEHLKAFDRNPETTVTCLCGRDEARARAKMQETGVSCDFTSDYEEMLARDDVQIVSICTPHHRHVEEAILAAKAGKHLVLEKPIAITLDSLRDLRAAIEKAGVRSITCFELHWNPYFRILEQLLQDDAIGDVFYGEIDYLHGIGPWYAQYAWNLKKEIGASSLLTAGCHALNALLTLMGSPVTEVTAYSTRGDGEFMDVYEYNPTTVSILKFQNGAIGKVTSCIECRMPYTFPVYLAGTKGSIRDNKLWSHKMKGQTDWTVISTVMPDSGDVTNHPYQAQMDHFVDSILNDTPNALDIVQACHTHEVIFAADRSAEIGGPVTLPLP